MIPTEDALPNGPIADFETIERYNYQTIDEYGPDYVDFNYDYDNDDDSVNDNISVTSDLSPTHLSIVPQVDPTEEGRLTLLSIVPQVEPTEEGRLTLLRSRIDTYQSLDTFDHLDPRYCQWIQELNLILARPPAPLVAHQTRTQKDLNGSPPNRCLSLRFIIRTLREHYCTYFCSHSRPYKTQIFFDFGKTLFS